MFISRSSDSDSLVGGIAAQLRWLLDFDRCVLASADDNTLCSADLPLRETGVVEPTDLTERETTVVQSVLSTNASQRYACAVGQGTVLCLPLSVDGPPFGALLLVSRRHEAFDRLDCQYAQTVATYLSLAMDRLKRIEELTCAKDALERSNQDLQQFAYVASHDLQEPLRAVSGYCQLLDAKLGDSADAEIKTFLGHATDGAVRMQGLINSLLDYARVETRGKPLKATDTGDAVRESIANLSSAIEASHAKVHVGDLPQVVADRTQLVRLFQNLIGNAIKFRDAEPPQVEVTSEDRGDRWLFSVRDNGIGIESQYADRVFVIFQRLHGRGDYPGTGLGLAISKRIVERHGGTIWVESQPGEGSAFRFTLPKRSV